MKNNKIFNVLLILLVLLGIGCSSDNEVKLNPNDFVEPVFSATLKDGLVITEETLNEIVGTFSWEAADFGVNTAILYSIYAATSEDFSDEKVFYSETGITETKLEVTQKALNDIANEFVNSEKELTLYFRLAASIGEGSNPIDLNAKDITKVSFTNFYLAQELFMIGEQFGNWNWDSDEVVEMIAEGSDKNANSNRRFWTVKYFEANKEFKWSTERAWGKDFNKFDSEFTGEAELKVSGGNVKFEKSGLYLIYINLDGKFIHAEPARIFGIGDAFGGWDSEKYAFALTEDGKKVQNTILADGNLRMYVETNAKGKEDWWTREFSPKDGVLQFRGSGEEEELEGFSVKKGEEVIIDFNTNEVTIK